MIDALVVVLLITLTWVLRNYDVNGESGVLPRTDPGPCQLRFECFPLSLIRERCNLQTLGCWYDSFWWCVIARYGYCHGLVD